MDDFKIKGNDEEKSILDINNNKIYAGKSIVEFEYGSNRIIKIGYFIFNYEYLDYEIVLLRYDNTGYSNTCAYDYHVNKLKIIDTLQENKLGLVKENNE